MLTGFISPLSRAGAEVPGSVSSALAPPSLEAASDQWSNHFWSVGLTGERFTFKAGDGYELLGNSGGLAIGYGYIKGRWFLMGEGEMFVGPFDPSYRRILNVDYQGTAIQTWWGYSAEELDLRHPDGGYGFIFGFNYKDIVGKSVDQQDHPIAPGTAKEMRESFNHSVRATSFSITPGIFFCWMQSPRVKTSKSLVTRIEGYLLTLSYSMPIFSRYQAKYSSWEFKDKVNRNLDELEDHDPVQSDEIRQGRFKKGGKLKGHSITITFQALLGT